MPKAPQKKSNPPKNLPIETKKVQSFIDDNAIFTKTRENLMQVLQEWWNDSPIKFQEDLWADLDTVTKRYQLVNEGISFSRSYSYEPPMDFITCYVRIFDANDNYCTEFTAYFDYSLDIFDNSFS